jgi:hypothetical protein
LSRAIISVEIVATAFWIDPAKPSEDEVETEFSASLSPSLVSDSSVYAT